MSREAIDSAAGLPRESGELLRALIESAKDFAFFTTDPAGDITSWNAGAERVLGFEAEDALGNHVRILYMADDIERGGVEREMDEARRCGRHDVRRWHIRKDGSPLWAESTIFPLADGETGHVGFLRIIQDRTTTKNTDDARDRAEADLRLMLESSTDFAIFTLSPENRVASWNSGSSRVFGYSEEDIVGESGASCLSLKIARLASPRRSSRPLYAKAERQTSVGTRERTEALSICGESQRLSWTIVVRASDTRKYVAI